MHFDFHALTDTGRLRSNNEDAVAVDPAHQVVVLADGMGGYNAGEVASDMATRWICSELARWLKEVGQAASRRDVQRAMEICVDQASQAVHSAARAHPPYAGMGTTLVMGVFQASRCFIGHVGDSRCYRLRGHQLQTLTRDHTLLQEQIDAGLISPAQAAQAEHRHLLTRALGVADTVLLEVNEFPVEANDLFLFCSDGLNDMLADSEIAAILSGMGSLGEKAQALVAAANAKGGRDNISVILVQRKPRPQRRRWLIGLSGRS